MIGFIRVLRWGGCWGICLAGCGGAYTGEPAGSAGASSASSSSMEGTSVAAGGFEVSATAVGSGGAGGSSSVSVGVGAGGSAIDPTPCFCTRRPGSGQSFQCPPGVGQVASMTIGPAGGKLTLSGQQGGQSGVPFSIEVPANVFSADTTITVTETALAPPSGFVDYSPIYLVEPADLLSKVPLRIVVPWGNRDGNVVAGLAIYRASDPNDPFAKVADSYVNAGFMQGSVTAFGYFFAGAPKPADQANCP